jgi:hypothetical protein
MSLRDRIVKRLEGFSPIFEFLLTLSALVTLWLLVVQTHYTRAALEETRKSTRAAAVSAQAALDAVAESKRQFNIAQASASVDAAESKRRFAASMTHAQSSLAESRRQAEASLRVAQSSLAESRRQAEASLRVAQESLYASEPLTLVIEDFEVMPESEPLSMQATLRNVGAYSGESPSITLQVSATEEEKSVEYFPEPSETFTTTIIKGRANTALLGSFGPNQDIEFNFVFAGRERSRFAKLIRNPDAAVRVLLEGSAVNRYGTKTVVTVCFDIKGIERKAWRCQVKMPASEIVEPDNPD